MSNVDDVLAAVTEAIETKGSCTMVNLNVLEKGLLDRQIKVKTLNRSGLIAELGLLRDEQRTLRARAHHADEPDPLQARVASLAARENEIVETLWPARSMA